MHIYDTLNKKRYGRPIPADEIDFVVKGFTGGRLPDYQMSALLMAVAINGMDDAETFALTKSMVETGEIADLSAIKGVKVDKHSSGGVGDKTSPIVGAIVAACGVPVAKMSGKSLGFSGGTVDKLMSIPGYTVALEKERFFEIVNTVGVSIIGQTGNLAPADKKIYALRDVTATVESIPLIASSIMSKKIAGGADAILLDVKTGNGAFMKDQQSAEALAQKMTAIGKQFGKRTVALVTQMNIPLGKIIGTALEVVEMIEVMRTETDGALRELCLLLAANMLELAGKGSLEECGIKAEETLQSGRAYAKFLEMVRAQGGDVTAVQDTDTFVKASYVQPVYARENGYISGFDTERCGMASMLLGAGRESVDAAIDYGAGVRLNKQYGECVKKGDTLAYLYTNDDSRLAQAEEMLTGAVSYGEVPPAPLPVLLKRISSEES